VRLTKRLIQPLNAGLVFTTLALWAFSGDLARSVAVAFLVMSQAALGGTLLDRTFALRGYTRYERLFLDFVVGSSAAIAFVFAVGEIVGWPVAIVIVSALALVLLMMRFVREVRMSQDGEFDLHWFFVFVAVALMFLSRDYRWAIGALPGVLIILLVIHVRHVRARTTPVPAVGIGIGIGALVMVWAFVSRGELWWFITDDNQLFSSITTAITRFGPTDPLGPLGPLGIRYHVGTYVHAAFFELWTQAPPYVILERFLPALMAIVTAGIMVVTARRFSGIGPWGVVAAMFVISRVFGYSAHSLSFVHGVVVVVGIALLLSEWEKPRSTVIAVTVFASLGLMAAVIKASNIPIAALLTAVVMFAAPWRRGELRGHHVMMSAVLIGAIGAYGLAFLVGDRSSRQLNSLAWFGYARERFPDIATLDDRAVRYFASLLVLASTFVLPLLILVMLRQAADDTAKRTTLFGWVGVLLGIGLAVVSGNAATGYFVSVAVLAAYLVPLSLLVSRVHDAKWYTLAVAAALGTGFGSLSHWLIRFVNGSSDAEVIARIVLPSPLPWLAVAGLCGVILVATDSSLMETARLHVLVGALFVLVGVGVATVQKLDVGGELDSTAISVAIGEPLERDVAQWIDAKLPREAVLATNRFCVKCSGREWFERDLALVGDDYNFAYTETILGGNDFRLTSLSRRRFLIQGPRYLLVNGYPLDEAAARTRLSLEFANIPSAESRLALSEYGVTHFVVDATLTDNDSWAPWAVEVYRNGRFVVLRLD